MFDKLLSVQNVFTKKSAAQLAAVGDPVRRHEIRQESKRNNDFAGVYVKELMRDVIRREERTQNLEQSVEDFIYRVVM